MNTEDAAIWMAIGVLAITVLVLRALYLYAPRRWQPRGTVAKALRFAPLAALVAVVVPEVLAPWLAAPDAGLHALLDARVLSALALLVAARVTGNLLAAIGVGAVVLMVAG